MNIRDRIPVCPHGTKENIDFFLGLLLDKLERMANKPVVYASGYRCPECNEKVGGSKNSAHTRGKAVDIAIQDSEQRFDLVAVAVLLWVKRIGISKDHIHLDVDASLPQGVLWVEA